MDPARLASAFCDVPGLYLHIPFCRSLCPFCPYNKVVYEESLARDYHAALQQEISLAKNQALIGQTLDVLIEGKGEVEGSGEMISLGRSYRDAPVNQLDCRGSQRSRDPAALSAPLSKSRKIITQLPELRRVAPSCGSPR